MRQIYLLFLYPSVSNQSLSPTAHVLLLAITFVAYTIVVTLPQITSRVISLNCSLCSCFKPILSGWDLSFHHVLKLIMIWLLPTFPALTQGHSFCHTLGSSLLLVSYKYMSIYCFCIFALVYTSRYSGMTSLSICLLPSISSPLVKLFFFQT